MRPIHSLILLGTAAIYKNPETDELVFDADSLSRDPDFAGQASFAGEPGWEEDDTEEYEYGEEYDDDYEDEEFGYDDVLVEEDDEFGAPLGRRRRRARRRRRRTARQDRRDGRLAQRLAKKAGDIQTPAESAWGKTALAGSEKLEEAGAASVRIRLQHDFKAEDITFQGSVAGSKVTSIFFGDRVVWSNSDGIDTAVFSSNSFVRGMLKGQSLGAGLDITVNGEVPDAGTFAVTLLGLKPIQC